MSQTKRYYGTPKNYDEMLSQIRTELMFQIRTEMTFQETQIPNEYVNVVSAFIDNKFQDYIRNRFTAFGTNDKKVIEICEAILRRENE